MEQQAIDFARTQADGLNNIAPTLAQGQAAWQYAQSDNFLSAEEQTAVLQAQLAPYRDQLEKQLSQIGWTPEHLKQFPALMDSLFSGQQTSPLKFYLSPELKMEGRLRIVMTEAGPEIRVTPVQPALTIPQEIKGVQLSQAEREQLSQHGELPRPLLLPENGHYVPTFLRVDAQTNTVELWRVRAEQLPTKLMGIDLTKDQQFQLAGGHAIRLSGLVDKQGEPFTATVQISAAKQQLQFTDVSRLTPSLSVDSKHRQQVAHNDEGAKTDQARSQEASQGAPVMRHQQLETVQQLLAGKQETSQPGAKQKVH